MYSLTVKISDAGSRSELAQVLAKLSNLIQLGCDRGAVIGAEVTDSGTSTGKWNVSRGKAGLVPEAPNQPTLPGVDAGDEAP